jgi:hypothetical protein
LEIFSLSFALKPALQRRTFWSFAGWLLLGFACWEAGEVARGGRTAPSKALSPPLQSRSGERPALVREMTAGDPIANYLAQAKRGMTEQEVRWMLEDFQAAGLDRTDDELDALDLASAKAHRRKLDQWYLAALSDGLSLSPLQKEEVTAKLDARFASDLQRILQVEQQLGDQVSATGDELLTESDLKRAKALFTYGRALFITSFFAPWNLISLSQDQTALTLHYWVIEEWKRQNGANLFGSSEQQEPEYWLQEADPFADFESQTLIQDPISGNLLKNPGPMVDRKNLLQSRVFPFTPDQIPSWNKASSLLEQARCCHPAQLRMALLEDPNLFQQMRTELDGAAVQKSHSAISK